jgi:hypothetical protein
MDATPGRSSGSRAWVSWIAPGLVGLVLTAAPAGAAPIKAHRTPAVRSAAVDRWEAYFRQALRAQSLRVTVPQALRNLRADSNGLLPQTAFVRYLQWRRSLNPRRFDLYHPRMGPLIGRDQIIRNTITPQVITPPKTNPQPQPLEPPKVPEPSSLAIAGCLVAAAWAGRRRRGSRAGEAQDGAGPGPR